MNQLLLRDGGQGPTPGSAPRPAPEEQGGRWPWCWSKAKRQLLRGLGAGAGGWGCPLSAQLWGVEGGDLAGTPPVGAPGGLLLGVAAGGQLLSPSQ